MNILVVDDEPSVCKLIARFVRGKDRFVTTVESGGLALRAAEAKQFDVAIIDYMIPEPNGLELLARFRVLQPDCVNILISGLLDVDVVMHAVNRGDVACVIQKPFTRDAVVSAVNETLVNRKRVRDQYVHRRDGRFAEQREYLCQCLRSDDCQLMLQPIITSSNQQVFGYEALLRSTHPQLRGPLDLLRAAEAHSMVPDLSSLVARRAADWLEQIDDGIRLFVNMHPAEFADPDRITRCLAPLRPFAGRVVLELTEGSDIKDGTAWLTSIDRVRGMGFSLAIDDVGSGYSSLSLLGAVKPDFIKIDMSIIRNIDTDTNKQHVMALLCQLGSKIGSSVIAEGVETEAENVTVRACGAHLLQGNFYGWPASGTVKLALSSR